MRMMVGYERPCEWMCMWLYTRRSMESTRLSQPVRWTETEINSDCGVEERKGESERAQVSEVVEQHNSTSDTNSVNINRWCCAIFVLLLGMNLEVDIVLCGTHTTDIKIWIMFQSNRTQQNANVVHVFRSHTQFHSFRVVVWAASAKWVRSVCNGVGIRLAHR